MTAKDKSKFGYRTGISAERFVSVWQMAKTLQEVAVKLHIRSRTASTRAASLRRLGVRLQRFKNSPNRLNVSRLNEIGEEAANAHLPG